MLLTRQMKKTWTFGLCEQKDVQRIRRNILNDPFKSDNIAGYTLKSIKLTRNKGNDIEAKQARSISENNSNTPSDYLEYYPNVPVGVHQNDDLQITINRQQLRNV